MMLFPLFFALVLALWLYLEDKAHKREMEKLHKRQMEVLKRFESLYNKEAK